MEENIQQRHHTMIVDDRNRLSLSGVTDVGSFDEENLKIITDFGEVIIRGENIQVTVLNLEKGEFAAEGKFTSIVYTDKFIKGSGFFSRMFR